MSRPERLQKVQREIAALRTAALRIEAVELAAEGPVQP